VVTNFLPKKPLLTTVLGVLGAVVGLTGTAIFSTVLGLVPPAAASPTTAKLDLTMTATFACPFSCAGTSGYWVWISGTAYSGGTTFKLVADYLLNGTISKGCYLQSGELSFTQQSGPARGDAFWLTTAKSKICPTANPSMLIQTDSFTVRGGTGIFKGATGKATDSWAVLLYPQVADGEFLASITY
jgi:hypothetical protein